MTWPVASTDCAARLALANKRIPRRDGERQLRTVEAVLERLAHQPGMILADEVGMGKTFVALGVGFMAALADQQRRPVIVMVPSALADKWPRDFEVFRHQVLKDPDDRRVLVGYAATALDFYRLLDDGDKRIIFLKHGAFHVQQIDPWTRLALIQRALRGLHLRERRSALPRFAADLIRIKSKYSDPKLFERLLKTGSSDWKRIINQHLGPESDLLLTDDPVPVAVQSVLDSGELDVSMLSDALRDLPARASKTLDERLAGLRHSINVILRTLWPLTLRKVKFKSPLLILDEAHHLKNPATRLASLFVTDEHEKEMREVDGALEGTFERMLLLTATPFQLGHEELLKVMSRFRGVDWDTIAPGGRESFDIQMNALRGDLDRAQSSANELDIRWKNIRQDDLNGLDPESWWERVRAQPAVQPEHLQETLRAYDLTRESMRRAQNGLSTWVIRHLRDRQLPESDQSRRVRRVGAAIALNSPEDTAHGLPVEGEALLPFLLATRAQAAIVYGQEHARRATFADGLASSYEAFRETRAGMAFVEDRPTVEAVPAASDARVEHYLSRLEEALPGEAATGRHPKVAPVVERVVDLWQRGEKVVVFCHYRKTGSALVRHISAAVERALWQQACSRSGLTEGEARAAVQQIGDRFDSDGDLGRRLDKEIQRQASMEESLRSTDMESIQNIVRRFVRTPLFVARYFDLHHSRDDGALATALSAKDHSEKSLRSKLEDFISFVATRTADKVDSERDAYLSALSRIQPGMRGERPEDDAVDSSGSQVLPNVRLANGETDMQVRQRLMLSFNTPFYPEILVASSVLAEGVDLHLNCRYVIHHDLDWNPSTIEQRTGRVDRLGAKAEKVKRSIEIFMPFVAATQDEKQFRVVTDRERWFQVLMGEKYETDDASTDAAAERVPLPQAAAEALRYDLAVYREPPEDVAGATAGSPLRGPLTGG